MIEINISDSSFIIRGSIDSILQNKRIMLALNGFQPTIANDTINVPYLSAEKVNTLQNLLSLFQKFEIEYTLSESINVIFSDFKREVDNFEIFSEKAEKIRNNEFYENPELVSMFEDFQRVISEKITKRKLYDLQMLSAFHMAFSQNSCNFAVPGAGKTTIVYAAYTYLKNLPSDDSRHVDKLLIIGPISSFLAWESQYLDCFGYPIKSTRLVGDLPKSKRLQHLYSGDPNELTLIHHGNVAPLVDEIKDFLNKNKTMVVVDEAHKIKNSRGLWGISVTEISKYAKSRVVLTGTPAPNGYEDLYNLYKFIYPVKYKDILKIHLPQLEDMTKNSDESSQRVKDFIENISPYFIRIKKKDLKLPPIKEETIYVNMDDSQGLIYNFIEEKYVKSFKENSSATLKDLLNKAKLIRLRQAAINPALLTYAIEQTLFLEEIEGFSNLPQEFQDDIKIKAMIQEYQKSTPPKFIATLGLINDKILSKNGKVIIWTIFIQNAKQLQEYLKRNGIKSELLIGEVETGTREEIINKFNNPENHDFSVVIANPFSVAESISLHMGCHNAIYIERDYNCSNFLQSKDRIHRVGLSKNQATNYYYIVSKDTVDEIVSTRLNEKIKRMEVIIDGDIPLFSRIDNDDETDIIKDILRKYAGRS